MNTTADLASFIAAWDLFSDAVWAGTWAGLLLGMLGVYVVLRGMVFLSAALSQAAGLGVALVFFVHATWGLAGFWASPTLWAAGVTMAATALFVFAPARNAMRQDSLLGAIYLFSAAGTLVMATRIVQDLHDIQTLLFGSAVVVLPEEFRLLLMMTAALVALHAIGVRGFMQASFDPDGARIRGLPVRLLDTLLLLSLAVAISVCTRILGALPVFAFSVLPAMAALRIACNVRRALLWGGCFGAISGAAGYVVAFCWHLPVGASQALTAAILTIVVFTVAASVERVRQRGWRTP